MVDFLIDNTFVTFEGRVFQQTTGISMGTNCTSLLADLFLHYYEADFIQELHSKKESFNFTSRNIANVLSLNNSKFSNYVERIYPIKLEIKDTTDTVNSTSYRNMSKNWQGRLKRKKLATKEMISASQFWTFHFYVATF